MEVEIKCTPPSVSTSRDGKSAEYLIDRQGRGAPILAALPSLYYTQSLWPTLRARRKTYKRLAMSTDPLHPPKEATPLMGSLKMEPLSKTLGKKLSAEFIGTFFLCFSIALSAGHGAALAPLAIGATLMVMIYALGHVSGAHFNPAVTVAVGIRGKIAWSEAIFYILAQLIGAFVAGGVAYGVLNDFETCFAGKIACKEGGYPSKPDDVPLVLSNPWRPCPHPHSSPFTLTLTLTLHPHPSPSPRSARASL